MTAPNPEAGPAMPELRTALAAEQQKAALLAELGPMHRRAQQGDPETLAILRAGLPDSIWSKLGNLADLAETALVRRIAGSDAVLHEAVPRKLEELRQELAGPTPSPLERMLTDRVVLTWADCYGAEVLAARRDPPSELDQRRLTQAHQRHLSAIRMLAVVRRLQAPTLMRISLADRQVDVATLGSPRR